MNVLMLGFGVLAFVVGLVLLVRRAGSEQARVARRIGGTMSLALGLALVVFAVGLGSGANA